MRASLPLLVLLAAGLGPSCSREAPAPPREDRPPATSQELGRAPSLPLLEHEGRTDSFVMYSSKPVDFQSIGDVAERTRKYVREWMGEDPATPDPDPTTIYVLHGIDEVLRIERVLGVDYSGSADRPQFGLVGLYCSDPNAILLPSNKLGAESLLSHEVVHSVFDELTGRLPDPLSEGLAEELARLVTSPDSASHAQRFDRPTKWWDERRPPDLEELFLLSHYDFRDGRMPTYLLSQVFCQVLMEHPTPQVPLQELLRAVPDASDPWDLLSTSYPMDRVEHEWLEAVGGYASEVAATFTHRAREGGVTAAADDETIKVEALARAFDSACREVRHWAGWTLHDPGADLWLSRDWSTLQALGIGSEHSLTPLVRRRAGWRPADPTRPAQIAVEVGLRDPVWDVCVEAVHHVLAVEAPGLASGISEGLALVLAEWLTADNSRPPEERRARNPALDAPLKKVLGREDPHLGRLLGTGPTQFKSDDWGAYALSWCLAKVLVESEHPDVAGKLPRWLRGVKDHGGAWGAFAETYPVDTVDTLWREQVARGTR